MNKSDRVHLLPQQIISAAVMTSILSLSTGFTLLQAASAASKITPRPNGDRGELVKESELAQKQDDKLPRAVINAVRRDLSQKVGIPVEKLQIVDYSRQTWSNGCLGLAQPGEFCTQALVPGWRITVSDGRSNWVYRTNLQGTVLRLENQTTFDLPAKVAEAVLREASQQSSLPERQLRIIAAERREWSDSCLGLGGPAELCAAVIVPGWLVTVRAGEQRLVYRTSNSGSPVIFDRQASTLNTVKPIRIPANALPPPLQPGVVFRAITSGGFAGITSEINLYRDGRLIQSTGINGTNKQQIGRVSPQQVRQFLQLLQNQQFARLNRLEFPAPPGAADFFVTTFTSREGTTTYSDAQDRLPRSLQAVIQAWNQLLNQGRN